jgi:hypothetical protein
MVGVLLVADVIDVGFGVGPRPSSPRASASQALSVAVSDLLRVRGARPPWRRGRARDLRTVEPLNVSSTLPQKEYEGAETASVVSIARAQDRRVTTSRSASRVQAPPPRRRASAAGLSERFERLDQAGGSLAIEGVQMAEGQHLRDGIGHVASQQPDRAAALIDKSHLD